MKSTDGYATNPHSFNSWNPQEANRTFSTKRMLIRQTKMDYIRGALCLKRLSTIQMRLVLRGAWCDCIGYKIHFAHLIVQTVLSTLPLSPLLRRIVGLNELL